MFIGYMSVRLFYIGTFPIRPSPSSPVSTISLSFLAFSMFLTGSGGSGGLSAAINTVAKSFSDKTRASATGSVLAGFGLSAFTFSTIGHAVYHGEAGGLLLLLSLGTSIPLFVASFIVKPIPTVDRSGYEPLDPADTLSPEIIDPVYDVDDVGSPSLSRSVSLDVVRSRSRESRQISSSTLDLPLKSGHTRNLSLPPSAIAFTPRELVSIPDFWILFLVLLLLCGTGLMYINNAGNVALALFREGQMVYDAREASKWQTKQVGTVSIWNCAGRVLGGKLSSVHNTSLELYMLMTEVFSPTFARLSSTCGGSVANSLS